MMTRTTKFYSRHAFTNHKIQKESYMASRQYRPSSYLITLQISAYYSFHYFLLLLVDAVCSAGVCSVLFFKCFYQSIEVSLM